MTDATSAPEPKQSKAPKDEPEIVDAEVVEVETAHASDSEPVVATLEPDAVVTEREQPAAASAAPSDRVVYVTVPAAPRKLGNRGVGSGIAIAAAVVFTALLAVITPLVAVALGSPFSFGFLTNPSFYVPSLFFVIGFVLVVLVVNRANWWAYIIGSVFVGLIVYFGTIGLGLLTSGAVQLTAEEANAQFVNGLGNPFVIFSALLAREVALWSGALIARRGRGLKARNAERHAEWEREVAEKRAEGERSASASATL